MNVRRTAALIGKEFKQETGSFFFIFSLVTPLVFTLVLLVVFGSGFLDKPKLGLVDAGGSELTLELAAMDEIILKEFSGTDELKAAVETGAIDLGITLPADLDRRLEAGEFTHIEAYLWGGSLLKHRAVLGTLIAVEIRRLSGQEPPVDIETAVVGEGQSLPWKDRLLPFVVLISIVLGGFMIPATSLVTEKQNRTLKALVVAPATLEEVFLAKGLVGFSISLLMGAVVLVINQAFGTRPGLLVLVLALGAALSAVCGILLGALTKDLNTLFATIKSLGIFLYAPAILYLFPSIPAWIAKLFPTYYLIQPVIELGQTGAGWPEVASDVAVLTGIILLAFLAVAWVGKRLKLKEI